MNYVGIDIHKRYSILAAQDEEGRKLKVSTDRGQLGQRLRPLFPKLGRTEPGGFGSAACKTEQGGTAAVVCLIPGNVTFGVFYVQANATEWANGRVLCRRTEEE
jgi:hypothetical protein